LGLDGSCTPQIMPCFSFKDTKKARDGQILTIEFFILEYI